MLSIKVDNCIDLCDSPQTIDLASDGDPAEEDVTVVSNFDMEQNSSISRLDESGEVASTWQPFYLNSLRSDAISFAAKINNYSFCLKLDDIIFSDKEVISLVVILTFEIDPNWLLTAVPVLLSVPLLVLHGGSQKIDGIELENITMSPVDMGIERYGTHHNKIIFVFYETGMRIAVTTANFTETDWTLKLQGTYVQDFPLKTSPSSSEMECSLLAHCDRIQPLGRSAELKWKNVLPKLRLYDYSSAEVVLISSVPGRHQGPNKNKWGQWKLRDELSMSISSDPCDSRRNNESTTSISDRRLLLQFSSIGSLKSNETYIDELAASMCITSTSTSTSASVSSSVDSKYEEIQTKKKQKFAKNDTEEYPIKKGRVDKNKEHSKIPIELVWPTVNSIRGSIQGWGSGFSMPCDEKVLLIFCFYFFLFDFRSLLINAIIYFTILYYTILYYTILYYTILYYTILYYTILYYTILYYTIPYYTYYTILYCISLKLK